MMRTLARLVLAAVLLAWAGPGLGQLDEGQAERLREGQARFEAGDFEAAAETLESLTEENPALADAHRLLGHAWRELGRIEDARRAFVESLRQGRLAPDTLSALAQIDRQRGRDPAVIVSLLGLTLLEPDDPQFAILAGQMLLQAGGADAARAIAGSVIERHPTSVDASRLLANAELQAGRAPQAIEALAAVYYLGAEEPDVARRIAELHFQQRAVAPAIAWYRRALATAADARPAWRLRLAELLIADRRYDEARDLLVELREAEPEAVDRRTVYRWLGHVEQQRGHPERAADAWRAAVDHGLREPQVLGSLVRRALETDDAAALEKYIPLLAGQTPGSTATVRLVVLGHLKLNQPAEATTAVRRHIEQVGLTDPTRNLLRQIAAALP
jgi:tetratricopeptide (TPR) repeat protein